MASAETSESESGSDQLSNSLHCLSGTQSTRRLALPPQFFEFLGNVPGKQAGYYKCTFPNCSMKKDKNGKDKPLIVYNVTRSNAKRHFCDHDPTKELNHEQMWKNSCLQMKQQSSSKEGSNVSTDIAIRSVMMTQTVLDNMVLNWLIVDVLPLNSVEKPGFRQLMNRVAPNIKLHGRTYFTDLLEKKFNLRRQVLCEELAKCTDASTTVDAWTSRRKSYVGETVYWFEKDSIKRKNACLAIKRIRGSHTYDVLARMIEDIHVEFNITSKLRGSTTDNGSNFVSASGKKVPPPTSLTITTTTTYIFQMKTTMKMVYIDIGYILDKRPSATKSTGSRQITLPVHRRCACHLLNLVSKADVDKITEIFFSELRSNVEGKLQMLWNKQSSSSNHSDTIHRHLGQLFLLKNETRWNSLYFAIAYVVRVMRKKGKSLRKLLDEFKIPFFTPSEEQYMKEYTKIVKSVAEDLEILEGEKNVGLEYLLPTITVLKSNLSLLQDDSSIYHCQPLISRILDAIDMRFHNMFDDKELWLAAISNPMFKTSGLEDDADVRKALSLIRCEFQRHMDYVNGDSDISDGSSDETSSSKSEHGPAKRSKQPKKFFAKFVKRNPNNKLDEVDMFLKDCTSLEELVNYPTILKIYKRFNVALP